MSLELGLGSLLTRPAAALGPSKQCGGEWAQSPRGVPPPMASTPIGGTIEPQLYIHLQSQRPGERACDLPTVKSRLYFFACD